MKQIVHFFAELPEVFLVYPVPCVWTDKQAEAHDGSGKCPAGAACFSHTSTETCTELLGLFGRETAIKAVVKDEQECF